MDKPEPREISGLLLAWAAGDRNALDRLAPLVYPQLRVIARRHLRSGGPAQTLQTTALVNEAFLHLVGTANVEFEDRDRFFAFAAQVMRRIVIDAARARLAEKRGGGAERADAVVLDQIPAVGSERSQEFLALEEALLRLKDRSSQGKGHRAPVFRRSQCGRGCRGFEGLAADGDAGLEAGAGLVSPRTEQHRSWLIYKCTTRPRISPRPKSHVRRQLGFRWFG